MFLKHIIVSVFLIVSVVNSAAKAGLDLDEFDGFDDISEDVKNIALESRTKPQVHIDSDEKIQREKQAQKHSSTIYSKPTTRKPQSIIEKITFWEIGGFFFIGLFVFSYYMGKKTNRSIAMAWITKCDKVFSKQFMYTGVSGQTVNFTNENRKSTMIQESPDNFKYYCTGRRYAKGLVADLKLVNRQNLYSILWGLVSPVKDTLTIDIAMDDPNMEPFICCISRKDFFKSISKSIPELSLTRDVPIEYLSKKFVVSTDCAEVIPSILTKIVRQTLEENCALIDYILFTDANTTPIIGFRGIQRKIIRLRMSLPSIRDVGKNEKLMEMICHFIDIVAVSINLSREAKKKADQHRKKKVLHQPKQTLEEIQQEKKREKLQKEREVYNSLSYEQQQKHDELKQKKLLRKRQNKMKARA